MTQVHKQFNKDDTGVELFRLREIFHPWQIIPCMVTTLYKVKIYFGFLLNVSIHVLPWAGPDMTSLKIAQLLSYDIFKAEAVGNKPAVPFCLYPNLLIIKVLCLVYLLRLNSCNLVMLRICYKLSHLLSLK